MTTTTPARPSALCPNARCPRTNHQIGSAAYSMCNREAAMSAVAAGANPGAPPPLTPMLVEQGPAPLGADGFATVGARIRALACQVALALGLREPGLTLERAGWRTGGADLGEMVFAMGTARPEQESQASQEMAAELVDAGAWLDHDAAAAHVQTSGGAAAFAAAFNQASEAARAQPFGAEEQDESWPQPAQPSYRERTLGAPADDSSPSVRAETSRELLGRAARAFVREQASHLVVLAQTLVERMEAAEVARGGGEGVAGYDAAGRAAGGGQEEQRAASETFVGRVLSEDETREQAQRPTSSAGPRPGGRVGPARPAASTLLGRIVAAAQAREAARAPREPMVLLDLAPTGR